MSLASTIERTAYALAFASAGFIIGVGIEINRYEQEIKHTYYLPRTERIQNAHDSIDRSFFNGGIGAFGGVLAAGIYFTRKEKE